MRLGRVRGDKPVDETEVPKLTGGSKCGCRNRPNDWCNDPTKPCKYPSDPRPDPILAGKILQELSAKHGNDIQGALLNNTHLKCSRSFSFIDRPFRDPDYASAKGYTTPPYTKKTTTVITECCATDDGQGNLVLSDGKPTDITYVDDITKYQLKIIVFGVGSAGNLIADFERHGLATGDWEYTLIIPGTGPRLLAADLTNAFYQNMDAESGATGNLITDPFPKPTVVIKDAQTKLATLMNKGVNVVLCLNAADGAYAQGVFKNPALPGNPTLLSQLFDSRIKLATSGVGYATELSAKGIKFWELH